MSWSEVRRAYRGNDFYGSPIRPVRAYQGRPVIDVHGEASFGATALGNIHTYGDINNLVANYDVWIVKLAKRFKAIQSQWQVDDPQGSLSFENDLMGLQERWEQADKYAHGVNKEDFLNAITLPISTISGLFSKWSDGTFANGIPNEQKYLSYLWAIRQNGEGEPVKQGDYSDLLARVTVEEHKLNVTPDPELLDTTPIQPTHDQGLDVLKQTNFVPTPTDISYWLKLLAVGVGASLLVQLINSITAAHHEFTHKPE